MPTLTITMAFDDYGLWRGEVLAKRPSFLSHLFPLFFYSSAATFIFHIFPKNFHIEACLLLGLGGSLFFLCLKWVILF